MKKYLTLLASSLFCLGTTQITLAQTGFSLPNPLAPVSQEAQKNPFSQVLKDCMPAVVNILASGKLQLTNDPFLQKEFENDNPDAAKALQSTNFVHSGSGVIIDASHGLIVTNAHVIDQAQNIMINLSDGRRYLARVIGKDMDSDVAVLQIQAKNLTALPIANSDQLQVGDQVAAIGSPFGLQQTVTSGIISGLHRNNLNIEGFEDFVQTDAPINSGNSGGALINTQGELVGMNTAILADDGGSIGIGFAIPSNLITNVVEQILKYGSVKRGVLGVLIQALNPQLADAMHSPVNKGALVSNISPNSPAAAAGIQIGDIVTAINGTPVDDNNALRSQVGMLRIGDAVKLSIVRNGKNITINTKVGDPQQMAETASNQLSFLLGLSLANTTEALPNGQVVQGIKILNVASDSLGNSMGLQKGDIIVSANNQTVKTVDELQTIAKQAKDHLLLRVVGANGAYFVLL